MPIVRRSMQAVTAAAALLATAAVTGCAVGNVASSAGSPTIQAGTTTVTGRVMGGQQPIGGATIRIYQTGNAGYGAGSTLLATTTSTAVNNSALGVAGNFSVTIPAVSCPTNAQSYAPAYYATASGGDSTGATPSNLNTQILLVSLFDTCASGQAQYVSINELTTVAAAYALRSFTTDASGTVSVGTPSTNYQGFNDALANANLLVNAQTGKVNTALPAVVNGSVILPTNMLNTLADILGYCVNEVFATSNTPCTNFFASTTPPAGSGLAAPTDTFQAAMNMAQFPGSNVTALLGYVPGSSAPYTPTVAVSGTNTVLNDLSLGIGFANSAFDNAGQYPTSIAIDAKDNLFAVAYSGSAGAETSLVGQLTSSAAGAVETTTTLPGTVATPQQIAFDNNNNLWLTDSSNGAVIELPNENVSGATTFLLTSPDAKTVPDTGTAGTADIAQNTWGIAIDAGNDVFTASYRSSGNCKSTGTTANSLCQIEELPSLSSTFNATFNGVTAYTNSTRAMAVDSRSGSTYKGNAWATDYGDSNVHILNPSTGVNVAVGIGSADPIGIALDANSNAWVATYASPYALYQIPASDIAVTGTQTSTTTANAFSPAGIPTAVTAPGGATAFSVGGIKQGRYVAIDGAGVLWVANAGNDGIVEYNPTFNTTGAFLSPYYGFNPSVSQSTQAINIVTLTATTAAVTTANNLIVGQTVAFSGFTGAGTCLNGQTGTVTARNSYSYTATVSSCTAGSSTTETGIGSPTVINPSTFSCNGASPNVCTQPGILGYSYAVAVDRAGSVWSIVNSATFLEMLGPGTPVNPIQAAGAYGVRP